MMIDSRPPRLSSIRVLRPHDQRAAAELEGGADAVAAEDGGAGREVRPRHDLHDLLDGELGIVDQRAAGVDQLAEIVRRDVGRHADGDAARAVDQQVGERRRQDRRLALALVVVRLELDRVLVDVGQQRLGGAARAAPRCSAWPPADRRPSSRNCPARRSAAGAWRSPAPCAPWRRRSPCRRAGDTCPSRRRRCGRTCGRGASSRSRLPSWRRGCGAAPASSRRARRAARATRSRSWRNRGRSGASPLRWLSARCRAAAEAAVEARLGAAAPVEGSYRRSRKPGFARFFGPARGPGGTKAHPSKTARQDQQKSLAGPDFNLLILLTKLTVKTPLEKALK